MNENLDGLDGFEKEVLCGLNLCGIETGKINQKNPLGAAVSGGADSVSLLVSLSKILEQFDKKNCLEVITVNHKIRPKNQTDGDAAFVEELCGKLGVNCTKITFEEGEVAKNAIIRKKGTEEAAREMRYAAFENFIKGKNLCALCLAHNQNDQTETVLMRLLSGSGSEGLGGIPRVRGKIARPLLEIPRAEIEKYLENQKITWRTDSTNFDNHYSRNKIRNVLVPFLDENFSGWKNSVVLASRKLADDNSFIQRKAEKILEDSTRINTDKKDKNGFAGKSAEIEAEVFFSLDFALERRIIYSLLNRIGFGERFPFKLVEKICGWKKAAIEPVEMTEKRNVQKILNFENLKITLSDGKLEFENRDENGGKEEKSRKQISSGYQFLFMEESDSFEFDSLKFFIEKKGGKTFLCVKNENFPQISQNVADCAGGARQAEMEVSLPFFVGSAEAGEKILAADGKNKKIADIFSDWKVPEQERFLIPVVRKISGGIEAKAVLGSVLGFRDWVTKHED